MDFTWKTLEWEKTTVPLEGERNHYELFIVYTLKSLIQYLDYVFSDHEPLFMRFRALFISVFLGFPVPTPCW